MSGDDKVDASMRGFTITDRRGLPEDAPAGDAAADPPSSEAASESAAARAVNTGSPTAAHASAQATTSAQTTASPSAAPPPLPPVDFATFVLSLGSSALMHLGEVERPGSGAIEKNLPMAKHSIDILSMLEGKTRGNLSSAEAQLLENLLFDLRLRYVEATRKKS